MAMFGFRFSWSAVFYLLRRILGKLGFGVRLARGNLKNIFTITVYSIVHFIWIVRAQDLKYDENFTLS